MKVLGEENDGLIARNQKKKHSQYFGKEGWWSLGNLSRKLGGEAL